MPPFPTLLLHLTPFARPSLTLCILPASPRRHSQGMGGERKAKLVATVKSAADYARFPGIAGCQVKMLTGNQCAAASPITPAVVAEAKERLRSTLGFVGLTDHYNLSVCLLHSMHPGGGQIRPSSLANSRQVLIKRKKKLYLGRKQQH